MTRVTTMFGAAPGQLAASFSDPIKRLQEIGRVRRISFMRRSDIGRFGKCCLS